MSNPWEEYKKKLGNTRPWDLFNPNKPRSPEDLKAERMAICEACPKLLAITKQCTECGCFMELKTQLAEAECPLGKWHAASR